jgi:hypothetical protein
MTKRQNPRDFHVGGEMAPSEWSHAYPDMSFLLEFLEEDIGQPLKPELSEEQIKQIAEITRNAQSKLVGDIALPSLEELRRMNEESE